MVGRGSTMCCATCAPCAKLLVGRTEVSSTGATVLQGFPSEDERSSEQKPKRSCGFTVMRLGPTRANFQSAGLLGYPAATCLMSAVPTLPLEVAVLVAASTVTHPLPRAG